MKSGVEVWPVVLRVRVKELSGRPRPAIAQSSVNEYGSPFLSVLSRQELDPNMAVIVNCLTIILAANSKN